MLPFTAMEQAAILAPTAPEAVRAARALARVQDGLRLRPYSLAGFLRSRRSPPGIVLSPGEGSLPRSVEFLRRVRRRLLWPPPSADLLAAISGLISRDDLLPGPASLPTAAREARPRAAGRGGPQLASALLLEGEITPERVRALLASAVPRMWIVESAQRVRLSESELERLETRGVRWRSLEKIPVLALAATPALARERARWRAFLPARTPVWILPRAPARGAVTPPRRPSPRRRG